ncbi:NAD(P)H-binding protein [Glycomyces paridis]|uniref:NAD-dependent epimerase/dehydratase family protein n=1 Tax=Glycomyces paridis TaxID=2126555 RepID=A0A4S8P0M2_9ACTN|nr:NAD(P)H-binding protein [Glycomyces paridis]THV23540.1 NAD-dependent epimerase/dehydratase family protein [Glycomyces paridis]
MTILITGATGNVGRHLVERLAAEGHPVRALARDPDAVRFPAGVETVAADLTDPSSVEAALEGATGLHLMSALGSTNLTLPNAPELLAAAAKAGVRRVTVLWNGFRGPVEEAVEASGLEWTHLQPGEFMSNAATWADDIRSEGVVREPYGRIAHAPTHPADIAAVGAAALTTSAHAGRSYPLTGPQALAVPDQVAAIAEATGRDLRYVELTREEGAERMRAMGMEDAAIDYVLDWRADPPAWTAEPSDLVEQITGAPARTFAQWAAEHAALFR